MENTDLKAFKSYDKYFVPDVNDGFNNSGVICWLNSLLQFLIGLPMANAVILENEEDLVDNNLAQLYIKLVKHAIDNNSVDIANIGIEINAALFGIMSQKNNKHLLNIGQQCAEEGFTQFVNLMVSQYFELLFKCKFEYRDICTVCGNETIRSSNADTPLYIMANRDDDRADDASFTKYLRIAYESIDDVSCEKCTDVYNKIPTGKRIDFIEAMVAQKMQSSKLQSSVLPSSNLQIAELTETYAKTVKLTKTKDGLFIQTQHNRIRLLAHAPPIICVVFADKADPTSHKYNSYFAPEIQFTRLKVNLQDKPSYLKYRLAGVIEHSGSSNSGHYIAKSLRRDENGNLTWMTFNDSIVTKCDGFNQSNAFILAYHLYE